MDRPNKTVLALVAGFGLIFLFALFIIRGQPRSEDRLNDPTGLSAAEPELNSACAGQAVYEQIKRALFRQAALNRTDDSADFDKLGAAASVRMENPAAQSEDTVAGQIDCFGSLALDLPPGATLASGRHNLMSDIDYSVKRAGAGVSKVVQLRNADALVDQLAGLTIVNSAAVVAAPAPPPTLPSDMGSVEPPTDPTNDPARPVPQTGASPASAQPSFDCDRARTRGEVTVCSDPQLASLDQQMAAQFRQAMSAASPDKQYLLRQTRNRFLSFRDNCRTTMCSSRAYLDRMREISDIMEGRWQPPR